MTNGKQSMKVFMMNIRGVQPSEKHARAAFQSE